VLEVEDLTVRVGATTLVTGITFDVVAGHRVALVGASGSGKSVIASAVVGVTPPDLVVDGHVRIGGHDVAGTPVPRRPRDARAAMVFQDASSALAPFLTVGRQLDLALRHRGEASRRRADREELLRGMAFTDPERIAAARPAQLSGGQRQRVCIAMALASNAPVIVADEPTTALDVVSQSTVVATLGAATGGDRGPALLFVTHDLAVAAALCDRVVVADRGTIIETGTVTDILAAPRHPVTARLVSRARSADAALHSAPVAS
jgi:peptide/nickel transport system ATP-binding protein